MTINTSTGIAINGTTYSVYGVFGETVAAYVAGGSNEQRDFTKAEVAELVASGAATLVKVCEFCGSPNVQTFDLHATGTLCQCADCKSITSEGLDRGLFDTLFRTTGVPTSDSVQSFRIMVRTAGGYDRMRGAARGGVIFQWG